MHEKYRYCSRKSDLNENLDHFFIKRQRKKEWSRSVGFGIQHINCLKGFISNKFHFQIQIILWALFTSKNMSGSFLKTTLKWLLFHKMASRPSKINDFPPFIWLQNNEFITELTKYASQNFSHLTDHLSSYRQNNHALVLMTNYHINIRVGTLLTKFSNLIAKEPISFTNLFR